MRVASARAWNYQESGFTSFTGYINLVIAPAAKCSDVWIRDIFDKFTPKGVCKVAVYVDDMRRLATVRGMRRRWSHLIADTPDELYEFGVRLGLAPAWVQKRGTLVEHYDITDAMRDRAIALGAERISYIDLPIVTARLSHSKSRNLSRTEPT